MISLYRRISFIRFRGGCRTLRLREGGVGTKLLLLFGRGGGSFNLSSMLTNNLSITMSLLHAVLMHAVLVCVVNAIAVAATTL